MRPDAESKPETDAERTSPAKRFGRYRNTAAEFLRKTRDTWPLLTAYERFEQVVSLTLTALVSVVVVATWCT